MKANYVALEVADGTIMDAYISSPKKIRLDPISPAFCFFRKHLALITISAMLLIAFQSRGYVGVIAPELFHRTGAGFEGSYNDFPAVMPHVKALTTEGLEADIKASYDWLQNQDSVIKNKIGSIGFCMGGRVSFIARTCDIAIGCIRFLLFRQYASAHKQAS